MLIVWWLFCCAFLFDYGAVVVSLRVVCCSVLGCVMFAGSFTLVVWKLHWFWYFLILTLLDNTMCLCVYDSVILLYLFVVCFWVLGWVCGLI